MRRYFRGMFRAICERGWFETFRTGHVAVVVPALMLPALLPLALVLLPETSSSRGLEAGPCARLSEKATHRNLLKSPGNK